jgi:hypothetical protein
MVAGGRLLSAGIFSQRYHKEQKIMKVGLMAVVFGRVKGMGVMKAFGSHAERRGFSTLWAPGCRCDTR